MLPYFCFKYGAEEYEFWSTNWYSLDPYEYGWHYFTAFQASPDPKDASWLRLPNGDGNSMFPGRHIGVDGFIPTIRLKQSREGVEDYEYLYMLEQLVEARKKEGKPVSEMEGLLQQAENLIIFPSPEGLHSTRCLADPDEVFRVREKIANALEQ